MKILIINYEHPPLGGGGGVCTKTLARELVAQGHTVHIVTTGRRDLPSFENEDGVEVYRVPVLGRSELKTASMISMLTFPLTSIPKAFLLAWKHRYDVINTHFYAPTGPTGLIVSLLSFIPNYLYLHGADVYDPSRMDNTPAGKGMVSFLLRLSARIQSVMAKSLACQSSNTEENIHTYITKRPVRRIPLPFTPPLHPEVSRAQMNLRDDRFYLISAGRVIPRKGYTWLLDAMKDLPDDIELLLLGDGPELPRLKEQARTLGIDHRVHFLGYVESEEEKYRYYTAADMYVLSSLHEGMGIVLQEAMEFGLPIVATNHGGQVDLVTHEENGLLVPPADALLLRDAVMRLYEDPLLRKKFSDANRSRITRYYSSSIATEFLRWFSED